MKEKLIYFLGKYGVDFFAKLPLYRTAKCNGVHVALELYDPKTLTFVCIDLDGQVFLNIDLFKLDDFCL